MIHTKGVSEPVSLHFVSSDFDCKCDDRECVTTELDENLPKCLDQLWEAVGPLKITSGFRCQKHNQSVGGSPTSQHLLGRAADVKSERGMLGIAIENAAKKIDRFNHGGIGTAYEWCHLDIRGTGPARWHYPYSWSKPKRLDPISTSE